MIPDFQALMRPILETLADGRTLATRDLVESLSDRFGLTPEERRAEHASGRSRIMYNRVHWAVTHLAKAEMLSRPRRGAVAITGAGRAVLQAPDKLNMARLRALSPSYAAFLKGQVAGPSAAPAPMDESLPPEEAISAAYLSHRTILAAELLDQLRGSPPAFFERVVIDVLEAMGYGRYRSDAATHLGGPNDGGVDGVIREDRLGLDVIYVQAKRWDGSVGRETVQAFAGSLEGHRARRGVIITTSHFTSSAHEYVAGIEKRIALIDGDQLAQLMIEHGVGVEDQATYVVKKVDHDYFELDS